MFLAPRTLTWSRWWRLGRPRKSFLRDMEHELLESVELTGTCLDLGGIRGIAYRRVMRITGLLIPVNIDASTEPGVVADLNRPLPFQDSSCDGVVCLNTLEHVEQDQLALREMLRVLKVGGQFHIMVPFVYQLHGAPHDFHRHTYLEWDRRLRALGLDRGAYFIRPVVWDAISSGYSVMERQVPWFRALLRPLSMLPGLLYYKWRRPQHGWANYALTYYIYGIKQFGPDRNGER